MTQNFKEVLNQIMKKNLKKELELKPVIEDIENKVFTGITAQQYEIMKGITETSIEILNKFRKKVLKQMHKSADNIHESDELFDKFMNLRDDYDNCCQTIHFMEKQLENSKDLIK